MQSYKPTRAARWGAIAGLGAALSLGVASPAGATDSPDPCRSVTVVKAVQSARRAAREIVIKALRPFSNPGLWAVDLREAVSDTTMVVSLCPDAEHVAKKMPLIDLPGDLELTLTSAPLLLMRKLVRDPTLFDPRIRKVFPNAAAASQAVR